MSPLRILAVSSTSQLGLSLGTCTHTHMHTHTQTHVTHTKSLCKPLHMRYCTCSTSKVGGHNAHTCNTQTHATPTHAVPKRSENMSARRAPWYTHRDTHTHLDFADCLFTAPLRSELETPFGPLDEVPRCYLCDTHTHTYTHSHTWAYSRVALDWYFRHGKDMAGVSWCFCVRHCCVCVCNVSTHLLPLLAKQLHEQVSAYVGLCEARQVVCVHTTRLQLPAPYGL